MTKPEEDIATAGKLIQNAHHAGKSTVMIGDREFGIKVQSKKVTKTIGGENKSFDETWLVAQPMQGVRLPVYSVAPLGKTNLRST